MPGRLRASLIALLGEAVDDVEIVERSWYARLHFGARATTRRNRILLRGSAEEFFAVYRAEGRSLPEVNVSSGFDEYDTDSIVTALFPAMAAQDSGLHEDRSRQGFQRARFDGQR